MKKIFGLIVMVALMTAMTACGHSNTPQGVVDEYLSCWKHGDARGMVELYGTSEGNPLSESQANELEGQLGIIVRAMPLESYEIELETVNGNHGVVHANLTRVGGSPEHYTIQLKKGPDGQWRVW